MSVKLYFFFLPINAGMCFRCSKEPSHLDGSFEYPQHMFGGEMKKKVFQYAACSDMWSSQFFFSMLK